MRRIPTNSNSWFVSDHGTLEPRKTPIYDHPSRVLVKVSSSSLNPIDRALFSGEMRIRNPPFILGRDFAGQIIDVGSNVWDFRKGDLVFGCKAADEEGSWSEYITVPEHQIALAPKKVDLKIAGAFPFCSLTAFGVFEKIIASTNRNSPTASQHSVFIHGGSGSVGSVLSQLLCNRGYQVSVSCSGQHFPRLSQYGVKSLFDYHKCSLEGLTLRDVVESRSIDTFVDGVNNQDSEDLSLHSLKVGGSLIKLHLPIGKVKSSSFIEQVGRMGTSFVSHLVFWKQRGIEFSFQATNPHDISTSRSLSALSRMIDEEGVSLDFGPRVSFDQLESVFSVQNSHQSKKITIDLS